MDYQIYGMTAWVEDTNKKEKYINIPDLIIKDAFDESLLFDYIRKNIPEDCILINTWCNVVYAYQENKFTLTPILDEYRFYEVYNGNFSLRKLKIRKPFTGPEDTLFDWETSLEFE